MLLGVQEVPGSNPGSPTKFPKDLQSTDSHGWAFWSPTGVQSHRFAFGHPWAACGFKRRPRSSLSVRHDRSVGQCGHRFRARSRSLEETKFLVVPIRMCPSRCTLAVSAIRFTVQKSRSEKFGTAHDKAPCVLVECPSGRLIACRAAGVLSALS